MLKKNLSLICSIFLITLTIGFGIALPIKSIAATQTNAISLSIAKVNQLDNGKIVGSEVYNPDPLKPNEYSTKSTITPDDDIRYRWAPGFLIDIKNVGAKPQSKNGYIKVYKGTEAKEENFIANAGINLPIKDIKSALVPGQNNILLQVVSNDGKPITPKTELGFSFNYTTESTLPNIEILSPKPGAVLSDTAIQDFDLKINNFNLDNSPKASAGSGKLVLYWDEVKPEKLVATVYKNQFKSSDFDGFSKIEDGKDRKLIFVLKDVKDANLNPEVQTTLEIKANYRGTIDIGLPKIEFIVPNKTDPNINLTENDKIAVKIDNFDLVDNSTDKTPEEGKGVMQVSIDNRKVADGLIKPEFKLSDLSLGDLAKGPKEIKVELVGKNFEKLNPEAKDTIKVSFEPNQVEIQNNIENGDDNQNPTWRSVMVILVVILFIGGIAVMITKA